MASCCRGRLGRSHWRAVGCLVSTARGRVVPVAAGHLLRGQQSASRRGDPTRLRAGVRHSAADSVWPVADLAGGVEVSGTGDLYLPADDSYVTLARERRLDGRGVPAGDMQAVVAVAKGNPKKITKWDDLLRPDVRVAQATPDGAAIGKLTRAALSAERALGRAPRPHDGLQDDGQRSGQRRQGRRRRCRDRVRRRLARLRHARSRHAARA